MTPRILPSHSSDYSPPDPNGRKTRGAMSAPPPLPTSELGIYRILSPKAGLRVSPLCLGAMSIGDQWAGFMGSALTGDKAFLFLDAFYEAGGNFIDCANNYQDEQTEMIIGEWMEARGIRDQIVLTTKYTTYPLMRKEGHFGGIGVNYAGNQTKSLKLSVDDSLKKLRTDYVDILYLHWWDYTCSIEEVMQSLNNLVKSGKVLHLGISDSPAWVVSQANQYAREHALTPFSVYQGLWNLGVRDLERDVIPMCRANGLAMTNWGALGRGLYKPPEELKERSSSIRGGIVPTEKDLKLAQAIKEVADEIGNGATMPGVAMAWCKQNMAYCFPVIGGTSIEHLKQNIKALEIKLTAEHIEKLSNAVPFDYGFPYTAYGRDPHYLPDGKPDSLLKMAGYHQFVTGP
ncbi:aryl-alcohol dehydrogenase [Naematelia encephala]|uniref:Aryl-alcohol dehydrogenase n=1 Tax=Naematelia encephala TaxID=71784 RepID=A0A1Y2BLH8_9TREE|nr:aryl-alcohol dehydrogenase [Naematelia encephala]